MLTSEEAARRLGVKVPTLYAYVSRGLLVSHPDPARRGSLFDLDQVEALATRSRGGRQTATRMATITTGVTQLDQELGPIYRGHLATELAGEWRFEDVAEMLWRSEGGGDWRAPDLGPCPLTATFDRMRWALVVCGASDPLRSDRRPPAVAGAARRATAALTEVIGPPPAGGDADQSIAARLAARLTGTSTALPEAAVNAALVLMADHELATSTMAVRLAASVRADPYDAFLAGWSPWPARFTAAPASRPTSCWPWPSGTARPAPSTTCCATAASFPASATPSTRVAIPALHRCWRWPNRC